MATELDEVCPIWGTPAKVWQWDYSGRVVESRRAGGRYRVAATVVEAVRTLTDEEKGTLTTWLLEQRRYGNDEPVIVQDVLDHIRSRRPLTYRQKQQRFFQMLRSLRFGLSDYIRIFGAQDEATYAMKDRLAVWIEATREQDVGQFLHLLEQEALVSFDSTRRIRLTPDGLDRLDASADAGAATVQAFVAMWFDPSMASAYSDGFSLGIRDAGYEPLRIDQKEHANKIDDEIIAEIRRSRFVVADFTSQVVEVGSQPAAVARGGVYYEAGFAQGLGIPVIWTTHKSCINLVHFDTRQYSHIVWDEPQDLRERLSNRIVAMLGVAPVTS